MARKAKTAAAVKETKSAALTESFAEIKKAEAEVKPAEKTEKVAETTETTAEEKKAPEKKEAEKKPAARKAPVKKTAEKAEAEVKTSVTLEFNGKQINVQEILDKAKAAAVAAKKDVQQIDVYVVANQNAAYYVIDGEGKDEYRVDF